jgi:dTDP-3-amino-3,4,6-trideoxy-alpha-D-glucose transaminase
VVDDAAQAHGAHYRGRPIGGLTSATAFSFYPSKNLGALGDGGAVTTNDQSIADRVRMLRNYGLRKKNQSERLGWNSRLDDIQAAVLLVKLGCLDEWNSRRRRAAARYREGLSTLGWVRLPTEAYWARAAYHLFVIRVRDRDALADHLSDRSIATAIHYPAPPYRQPAYSDLPLPQPLGDLDAVHDELLSLPMGPHMSDAQIDYVVEAVQSFRGDGRA